MADKVRVTITTVVDVDVMAYGQECYPDGEKTIEERMAVELKSANDDPDLYATMDGAETTVEAEVISDKPRPVISHENRTKFYESMGHHQIAGAGTSWFSMPVTLTKSDNEYLKYPVNGVIRIIEQGTDLSIIHAVFHTLNEDGSLGAPVSVPKAVFNFPMSPA